MAIYDSFGREVIPESRPDERVIAAVSLRDRHTGYPSKGLTPEKLGTIFREADAGDVLRQMELFEEMEEKDSHLFSVLQIRKRAVSGLDYEIVPYSNSAKDVEIADFVGDVIYGLPDCEDMLFDMLDAIGKGFSGLELYWDIKDKKNIVRHVEWIHPTKFTWAFSTEPKVITVDAPSGIDMPPFKFIFHRHKTKSGSPMRQGVLRVCSWMYLFKNYDIKDWVAFAEVYGMPLRLGKYDPSAKKEDKDALIAAVRSLGSDAAGIISKSTEIEFVEAVKNSGKDVYEVLAAFCNAEISKAVLGHSASADSTPGKLGNEKQASELREDLKRADAVMISKTVRHDMIKPLVGFNFGWDCPLPWFKLKHEAQEDLNLEATRYKTLVETGLPIGEDHMYEKFNVPKPGKGEKIIGQSGVKQSASQAVMANKASALPPLNDASASAKDTVDVFTERVLDEASLEPLWAPIEKLIAEATSLEDLRDRILGAYSGMDVTALGNLLQRAFVAAEMAGRFEALNPPKGVK